MGVSACVSVYIALFTVNLLTSQFKSVYLLVRLSDRLPTYLWNCINNNEVEEGYSSPVATAR